jgi:hypothetical protein
MAICVKIVYSCSVCGKVADAMFTVEDPDEMEERMNNYRMPDEWLGDLKRIYCSEECYGIVHGDILHTGVWRA